MFLRRLLAKRRHRKYETDSSFRLVTLTDTPWRYYNGKRAWCDGVERKCFCGDRCCECRHTEMPGSPG